MFYLLLTFNLFAVDATKVLKEAEDIRNPQVSYEGVIKITDVKQGKEDVRTYQVKSKNSGTTIVEYLTPAQEAGTKVLMSEEDMWVAMPKVAKPIRVAPKNKLVGNAAYGDIASINYQDSYNATLKSEDVFEGKKAFVLDLKVKPGKSVTYERIEYWIDQNSKRPLKTLYMTSSGKVLREGTFTGYKNVLGIERPLVLVLKDHLDKQLTTTIELVSAKEKTFPKTLFLKTALK